ncbi:MAG: DEAD/DEAH box helicase, partial [bacterium]
RGRDVIGQAQTGTGKTAAFGLPLVQSIDLDRRVVQALVMTPTRELAIQVSEALESFGQQRRGLRVLTVYGGASLSPQLRALSRGVHVVVGTPGRIADCMRREALSLADVRFAVLDEADEMLRMGFIDDVEWILAQTPPERQTAFFSATMPPVIRRIADEYLTEPVFAHAESETRTVAEVEQRVLLVHASDKVDALARVLEVEDMKATLVFARTRVGCRELAAELEARGFATAAMHGDLGQPEREDVVARLRAGRVDLVVATDVAARGLDVDCISHVVNFDPPDNADTYVHRTGRTGRAGRAGVSILLLTPSERHIQGLIERFTRQPMKSMAIPRNADLVRGRGRALAAAATSAAEGEDLAPYRTLVQQMIAESGQDAVDVAAAFARLGAASRPLVITGPESAEVQPPRPRREPAPRREEPRGPRRVGFGDGARARLTISLGTRVGLRPGDIVGAIANETGLDGRDIGPIEIYERHSFVGVPAERAQEVIDRMMMATIRGREAHISTDGPPMASTRRHLNRKAPHPRRR